MTSRNRDYPEISFVDTSAESVQNALIAGYEVIAKRKLYPGDPMRLFILWVADIVVQERALIDYSAKMNVPRYATGDYLDSIAELFKDVYRLEPEAARVTMRFWLTEAQQDQTLIPAGIRVTPGNEIVFATTRDLYIDAGCLSGDVEAVCLETGEVGNGFLPGQIDHLIDIYPYYDKVENITVSAGGAEREDDDAFYERIRESMETFSTAGSVGSYIYHAKTASAKIVDVAAMSPEPGIADIRVLCEGGTMPDEEIINLVYAQLNQDKVRPFTDHLTVAVPDTVGFSLDYSYYLPKLTTSSTVSASTILQAVENAQKEYILWQTSKIGRDINPSYFHALLMDAGVKRVEIRQPVFTVVPPGSVAVLRGEPVALNGGAEDE